jgi:uncharacterized membrane protein
VGVAALGAFFPAESVFSGTAPESFVAGLDKALWASAAIAVVGAVVAAALLRIGVRTASSEPTSTPDLVGSVDS